MYFYQAYSLNIRSDFSLPELPSSNSGSDLYIQQGQVDLPAMEGSNIPRQGIEAMFGGTVAEAYLYWPGVAKFMATGGNRLIVEPTATAIERQVLSLYILSEALGLILHQRNLLLIHASAILVDDQVIIFAGYPGAGKSTTAAAFAQVGYPVLSDDMVAIDVTPEHGVVVLPAFPQVKIWPASIEGLGYDSTNLDRLFPSSPKRVIRQFDNFPTQAIPLSHIFFLEKGSEFSFTPMTNPEAILTITKFFSCPNDLLQGQALARHFQQCIQILKQVGIGALVRPDSFQQLHNFVDEIKPFLARCHHAHQPDSPLQVATHAAKIEG
ncbi:MAG: hypothetical protein QNJ51_16860 [Calothrix sp. MO_167.B12]|nr:hypothetical protein [Calothrix sp. MO_167.B12]